MIAGFQRYSPASKQLCLAYISPWMSNLTAFASRTDHREAEKLAKIFDLLVSLTISEEEVRKWVWSLIWVWLSRCTH